MATVVITMQISANFGLEYYEISERLERIGRRMKKGRPNMRVAHSNSETIVSERWDAEDVKVVLIAKVVEGRMSHGRLFELLRRWRRTECSGLLESPDILAHRTATRHDRCWHEEFYVTTEAAAA